MPGAKPTAVEDTKNPTEQLEGFIAKFDENDQRLIREVREAMRKRLPTANEIVYDNYNFFVIGYGPSERTSEAVFSIAARANAVSLCFLRGAALADPKGVLHGGGNQVRFLRLESAKTLDQPDVNEVFAAAVRASNPAFPRTGRGRLIIRSISAKQQPRRRPPSKRDAIRTSKRPATPVRARKTGAR
jgi:hypothetical protein